MDEMTREEIIKRHRKYQNFMRSINCCPLCSTPLTLIHEIDEEKQVIKETAHCSECDVETRRKDHPRH